MQKNMNTAKNPDIDHILQPASPRRRWKRYVIALIVIIAIAGAWAFIRKPGTAPSRFRTTEITRGDLASTVTATGTLQARIKVDISSELSGTIAEVFVDYNSRVKKGEPLARLNTTKLEDQAAQTRANLQSAQAKVLQAKADVDSAQTALARLEKVAQLSNGQLPAGSELDDARIKLRNLQAAQQSAEASAAQLVAALHINETDLTKATIRAPIDGTVLMRSVDPGQTVAASLQAPVLFTIAQDLKEMDLNIAVAEADVGQLREGMEASFAVDAWPGKQYKARVRQIRYGAKTVDNVVSYETILQVKNDDLSLRPGMTATAELRVAERKGILMVPNAALRFTPPSGGQEAGNKNGVLSSLFPTPPNLRGNRPKEVTQVGRKAAGAQGRVWVLRDGQPHPLIVTVGLSDGRNTEVSGDEISEGVAVITRAETQKP